MVFIVTISPAAAQPSSGPALGLGQPAKPRELSQFFAIPPDGAGLPDGEGSVTDGKEIFTGKCAMCHGDELQGVGAVGAPALVGGRGSLKNVPPKKTVESYWPYATTLFDYVKRAMPANAPGSLKADEVYALCAYILARGHVVSDRTVLDRASLPAVEMPNRNGFAPVRTSGLRSESRLDAPRHLGSATARPTAIDVEPGAGSPAARKEDQR